jgi:hypothetical protein
MVKTAGSEELEVHEIVTFWPETTLLGVLKVMAVATLTAAARRVS